MLNQLWPDFTIYSSSPLYMGDVFQDPQGMPETKDSTEPYIHYVFSNTHPYDKV